MDLDVFLSCVKYLPALFKKKCLSRLNSRLPETQNTRTSQMSDLESCRGLLKIRAVVVYERGLKTVFHCETKRLFQTGRFKISSQR